MKYKTVTLKANEELYSKVLDLQKRGCNISQLMRHAIEKEQKQFIEPEITIEKDSK